MKIAIWVLVILVFKVVKQSAVDTAVYVAPKVLNPSVVDQRSYCFGYVICVQAYELIIFLYPDQIGLEMEVHTA